ncbi:MAG: NAD(+)/NADH kinase [Desulfobacterales bacterium]|nr:NAD(+)/NADH kinase [Desulfobacterales bacterium]
MKKIGLVVKLDEKAAQKANELEEYLKSKNFEVIKKDNSPAPSNLSYIFVLGGDGTFLNAVRWTAKQSIPIFGIKFGEVGFLAEITEESLFEAVDLILNNKYLLSNRIRLSVNVIQEKKNILCETVLNELVISKGALSKLINIKTYINDHYLTTYRADGLIISTPTGSTAYSLAAGGPILHPEVPGIVMTPICPFTLTNRPLIVPDSVKIKLCVEKKSSPISLSFDGQTNFEIDSSHKVIITQSPYPVHMITLPSQNYFDILKAKLRWSGGRV